MKLALGILIGLALAWAAAAIFNHLPGIPDLDADPIRDDGGS